MAGRAFTQERKKKIIYTMVLRFFLSTTIRALGKRKNKCRPSIKIIHNK